MVRVDCNLLTLLAWRQFGNQDSEFFCWNRRLLGKKMFAWRKLRITLSDTPILPHQQHPQAHIVIRIWGFPIASPRRFLCMTIQDFDVSEVQGSRLLDSDRCRVCWFSTLFYSAIPFDTGILTATFPHYGTALLSPFGLTRHAWHRRTSCIFCISQHVNDTTRRWHICREFASITAIRG